MELLLAFLAVIVPFQDVFGEEQHYCHYTSQTVQNLRVHQVDNPGDNDVSGKISDSGDVQECAGDQCYAFWTEDKSANGTGGVIYVAQGCWESSGKEECEANECISKREPPKPLNNTNFCCCTGNFCNTNASYQPDPEPDPTIVSLDPMEPQVVRLNLTFVTFLVALGMLALGLVLVALKIFQTRRLDRGKPGLESVHLMEHATHFSNAFNPDDLKLEALIGQGRYGVVWRGSTGDVDVAVKVFPPQHRMYFCNERDSYCLPFMNHPSLLTYYGCDERNGPEGGPELLLFLSLAPLGSLQGYLRGNTLDWNTFCKMALSIAAGLAHLHTDIRKGDKMKPCLSHRDLNSNNILVKDDLSCAICDLGFATQISGSKYYFNGEEQHAETKSITDVGTLRYMCPEVLEGAVNLRDCETSLKQIDVYALGLVLWELASRCSDFFPNGIECGPYRLPFEAEIGHPTLEQMQVLVCRHKARPLFPDLWRETAAVRTVRETIEDCWDHDAEARLTALCVEERFHELSGFTDRQKGVLYTTGVSPIGRGTSLVQKESHNVFVVVDEKEKEKENCGGGGDSCQSESTMDTLLTITPTNPQLNCKNSNQFYGFVPSLQPYQGRNPCLERNLMATREGDSSSGELIDKSHKHTNSSNPHMNSSHPPLNSSHPPLNSSHLPLNSSHLNVGQPQNIPQHHPQQQQLQPIRPSLPIPYVQNVSSEPTQPKLSNLLVGGNRRSTWLRIKQAFGGRPQSEGLIGNESAITVSTPVEDKMQTKVALSNGRTETKLAERPTEFGAQNNRRPNTLPLSGSSSATSRESSAEKLTKPVEMEEIRKSQDPVSREICDPVSRETHNPVIRETRDPVSRETRDPVSRVIRNPVNNTDPFGSQPQLKDPTSRVKTPGDVPLAIRRVRGQKNMARFSLYDDRIMTGCYDNEKIIVKSREESSDHRSSLDDAHFTQDI